MVNCTYSQHNHGKAAIEMITKGQCRAARGLVGLSQRELALSAKVAHRTLTDFERGARSPHPRTIEAIQRALEAGGVEFSDDGGVRPASKE
jgi:transcriptional regulator with XRE-family HTH domain